MAEKILKARIMHNHNTEDVWNSKSLLVPNRGEWVFYDPDETHDSWRLKIGDGITPLYDLPFLFDFDLYEDKTPEEDGEDPSLVSTGDKYRWNQNTNNTGTVTAVITGTGLTGGPITENGTVKANLKSDTPLTSKAVTGTEATNRTYPVAVDADGYLVVNIPWADTDTKNTAGSTVSNSKLYLVGAPIQGDSSQTYSNSSAYIGTNGALYSNFEKVMTTSDGAQKKTVQDPVADPTASGSSIEFISDITQNAQGVISPLKKTVAVMSEATENTAGTSGLVPAPAIGDQNKFLKGNGTWSTPAGVISVNGQTGDATLTSSDIRQNAVQRSGINTIEDALLFLTTHLGTSTNFIGATSSNDGSSGLVPAPTVDDRNSFLKGDGTWATIAALGGVTGVKGSAENTYRTGQVSLSKSDIGLGNVDNTSDANKPISNATQTALNNKLDSSLKGVSGGLAELDGTGKVPSAQLPFMLELGETSMKAYRGDRGADAYAHALNKGVQYNSGFYKITTNSEGHITAATPVTKADLLALIPNAAAVQNGIDESVVTTGDKYNWNNKVDIDDIITDEEIDAIIV